MNIADIVARTRFAVDRTRILLNPPESFGDNSLVDRINGQRVQRLTMRFKVTGYLTQAAGPQFGLLLNEVLLDQSAECVRSALDLSTFLRGRVTAKLHRRMMSASYLPRLGDLYRRCRTNHKTPGRAADLVLKNPTT